MKAATWRVRNLRDEVMFVVARSMAEAVERAAGLGMPGGPGTWEVGVTSPVDEALHGRVLPSESHT